MNAPAPSRTEMPPSLLGSARTRSPPCDTASCRPISTTVGPNHLDGKLIRRLEDKHAHVEWLRFLERIDELTIHVVADDHATQARQGPGVARPSPAVRDALHADLGVVARPGGALLRRPDRRDPRRRLRRRRRAAGSRAAWRRTTTIRAPAVGPPRAKTSWRRPGAAGGGPGAQSLIQPISSAGH